MYSGASVEEQHMTRNEEGASMFEEPLIYYTSDIPEYQNVENYCAKFVLIIIVC